MSLKLEWVVSRGYLACLLSGSPQFTDYLFSVMLSGNPQIKQKTKVWDLPLFTTLQLLKSS